MSTLADGARTVKVADLDGDGDIDLLSASEEDDKIAWYENLGGGVFGPQRVVTTSADGAKSTLAADLDQDGDIDVLSTSVFDNKIAWYENLGGGTFGPQIVLSVSGLMPRQLAVADFDSDGDTDLVAASAMDDKVAWYENLGGASFGSEQVITTAAEGARAVSTPDFDADGDADVLVASHEDGTVAWYPNLGGFFGPERVLRENWAGARAAIAVDLDGDGTLDVLSAAQGADEVAWMHSPLGDVDGDHLSEATELCISGTDPELGDSDSGGTSDGGELDMLSDPFDIGDDALDLLMPSSAPVEVGTELVVVGATPGATVTLLGGTPDVETPAPVCGDPLAMSGSRVFGREIADDRGVAAFVLVPPAQLAGGVKAMAAVEMSTCRLAKARILGFE